MSKAFHDFKITPEDNSLIKHVFIDGVEQKGVVACDIKLRPDEVPTIRLEYVFLNLEAALDASVVETMKTFTDGVLNRDIDCMGLSCRTYNIIKKGIWAKGQWMNSDHNRTIADVMIAYRTGHLKQYQGMGEKAYAEVIRRLKEFGLLAEDDE